MIKFFVGILFSFGGLYLAFRNIEFSSLGKALSEANVWWMILAVVLLVLSVWIRAARWQILLAPIKKIKISPLYATTMIGYFGNNVLPFRMGEILRAYALNKEQSISTAATFGTIVVERFLDMLSVVILMIFVFLLYEVPSWMAKGGIVAGSVVLVGGILLWWITYSHKEWIERFERISILQKGFGEKILKLFDSFVQGLITLKHTRKLGFLVISTISLWVIYLIVTFSATRAVNLYLSWAQIWVILIATTLVISIPSAPGYIGTWHAAAVMILVEVFKQPTTMAQTFAILNHAVGFVPLTLIGFYYLLKSSIKLREIKGLELSS